MSNREQIIKQIEESKKAHLESLAMLESLNRLAKNKDFIRVIDKGLFETRAIELVMSKGTPAMQTPENQADILRAIDGISFLRQHFASITQKGRIAKEALADADEAIKELVEMTEEEFEAESEE